MGYVTRALTSLPFGNIIGAPMKAAIEAQALAARSTIEFIQTVGFQQQGDNVMFPPIGNNGAIAQADLSSDFGEVRNVTFTYTSQTANGTNQNASLTVPILTIVPIPFLRIDEMTIDFMAKMTEEYKSNYQVQNDFNLQSESNVAYKSWWSPVEANFKVTLSTKHSSTAQTASRFATEATMNVHVRAVQDSMPAGLAKVLQILENAIREPVARTQPV